MHTYNNTDLTEPQFQILDAAVKATGAPHILEQKPEGKKEYSIFRTESVHAMHEHIARGRPSEDAAIVMTALRKSMGFE